jgi:hypothetical protein
VTYQERQRLADIQAAIDAIRSHLQRGDLSDGLVFDAVRIRLLEIGEAVKAQSHGPFRRKVWRLLCCPAAGCPLFGSRSSRRPRLGPDQSLEPARRDARQALRDALTTTDSARLTGAICGYIL